ncbi:MAG: DUF2807 domain-containing protein, partial [Lutibacter sp.]|nr:DUF2807 domain-containing protein [Lutibacter sp.]
DKIVVHEHVGLVLKEGPEQQVVVETGEHLLADVSVEVVEDRLVLRNNNTCNFFRDYGLTKVYITSPNIVEIRNASEQAVRSSGVLTYPSLYILSIGDE